MFEGMTLFTMMIMMAIMIGPWIMIVILQGRLRDLGTHVQQIEYTLMRLQREQSGPIKEAERPADAVPQRSVAIPTGATNAAVAVQAIC